MAGRQVGYSNEPKSLQFPQRKQIAKTVSFHGLTNAHIHVATSQPHARPQTALGEHTPLPPPVQPIPITGSAIFLELTHRYLSEPPCSTLWNFLRD